MSTVRQTATITSKGQLTLPKPIRQALGVGVGEKVEFALRDGEVVVSRAPADHKDPAIANFLALLEGDIRAGRNVRDLPEELAESMRMAIRREVDLEEDIEGDVAL